MTNIFKHDGKFQKKHKFALISEMVRDKAKNRRKVGSANDHSITFLFRNAKSFIWGYVHTSFVDAIMRSLFIPQCHQNQK